jgi:hypothetical protein
VYLFPLTLLRVHVQGAFELDCTVCPIAIKYNKIFVDAFWNSKKYEFLLLPFVLCFLLLWNVPCNSLSKRYVAHIEQFWMCDRQSFTMHLMRLMTSWAVVCDVWYLEPQTLHPGETPIEFAERWVSSENISKFAVIPYLICVHFVVSFLLSRLGKICLWVEGEHWTLTFGVLL